MGPYHLQQTDEFIRVLHLNVLGTMFSVKHSVPHLVAAGGGSFVGMSSLAGHVPHVMFGAYCVAKAGIEEMMKNAADEYGEADGTALCPFTVEGRGFPAVSSDGARTASFVAETLSSSDGQDELVTVRVTDVATDAVERSIVVVDGNQFDGEQHCKKLWRAARRRAEQMNRALGETHWLAMQPVSLTAEWDMDSDETRDELLEIPAGERPAQLLERRGEYVVRIPGVKVLSRISRDWYADDQDEMCSDFSPYVSGFHVEPTTGVAVATVEQMGGPCFCYAETRYRPWPMGTDAAQRLLARNAFDEA